MPSTNYKHVLNAIDVDGTPLGGLVKAGLETATQVNRDISDGNVFPEIQTITEQKPKANFETRHLKAALTLCGMTGLDIDGLAAGVDLYAKSTADGGTRLSGANHTRYTIRDGIILPRQLSAKHRENATITYDLLATYDGTNDPLVITPDVALPAAVTDDQRYTMGPLRVGTTAYAGKIGVEINFGITEEALGADSDVWDTEVAISETPPEITIKGINPEWFGVSHVPLTGIALAHASTTLFFRRRKNAGTFYPDADLEHIEMTVAGMAHIDTVADASGSGAAEWALKILPAFDGTNLPIVINTAAAIPPLVPVP